MFITLIILLVTVLIISSIALVAFAIKRKLNGDEIAKVQSCLSVIGIIISSIGLIITLIVEPKIINNNYYDNDTNESSTISTFFGDILTTTDSSSIKTDDSITVVSETTFDESSEKTITESTDNDTVSTTNDSSKVSFKDLKTYSNSGSVYFEDIISDPRGNTYNDTYLFSGQYSSLNTGGGEYDKPYIEKYLAGDYETFTATVNPYKTFDTYNKNIEAQIIIYADNEIVYSNTINRFTENESIIIDITGVKYLKIQLVPATDMPNYYNQYSIILSNAVVHQSK